MVPVRLSLSKTEVNPDICTRRIQAYMPIMTLRVVLNCPEQKNLWSLANSCSSTDL